MRIRLSTRLIALALCLLLCPRPEALAADKRPKNQRSHIEVATTSTSCTASPVTRLPGDGDQCRVRDRLDLLVQHIAAAGCPDLVTLQENVTAKFAPRTQTELVGPLDNTVALIKKRLSTIEDSSPRHLRCKRSALTN